MFSLTCRCGGTLYALGEGKNWAVSTITFINIYLN